METKLDPDHKEDSELEVGISSMLPEEDERSKRGGMETSRMEQLRDHIRDFHKPEKYAS